MNSEKSTSGNKVTLKQWSTPKVVLFGNVKKITKQVFYAGTGDNEPGMDEILASHAPS